VHTRMCRKATRIVVYVPRLYETQCMQGGTYLAEKQGSLVYHLHLNTLTAFGLSAKAFPFTKFIIMPFIFAKSESCVFSSLVISASTRVILSVQSNNK